MRSYLILAGTALATLAATPAVAQDDDKGMYVAFNAGIANVSDTEVIYYDVGGTFGGTGTTDSAEATADVKGAVAFGGTIGYDFGTLRADLEINYVRNRVKSITIDRVNGTAVTLSPADAADVCDYLEVAGCSVSGNTITFDDGPHLRQLSAMANLWFDLPVGDTVVPYVGGGIGAVGFEMDGEGTGKFAWQVGGGVAFKLSPSVAVTADVRHRQVSGETFPWDANSGFSVGRLKTTSISAGIRFGF